MKKSTEFKLFIIFSNDKIKHQTLDITLVEVNKELKEKYIDESNIVYILLEELESFY